VLQLKKKYITETYLKGVDDYDIKIIKEKDCYTCVKYIKNIDEKYISTHTGKDICLLDNGYYIVEYVPIDEKYVVRVFMNEKKQVLQYYIDSTKENGIEDDIPFYYDLYLDITIDLLADDVITIFDEDELIEAVKSNNAAPEDYILAHNTIDYLLKQIDNKENKYINRNHKETVNKLMNKIK